MSFREKSAWLTVGTLVTAFGWYLVTVAQQLDSGPVTGLAYQRTAVIAAIAVIVMVATGHAVLTMLGLMGIRKSTAATDAIRRYSRSVGGRVVTAGAVVAMTLAMFGFDSFWIANVLLFALVLAELTTAGTEILTYRRGI
jgi:hypothetical protein